MELPCPNLGGGGGRRIAQLAQRTKICKERKKPAKNRSKSNLYISVISFNFRCNKQERSLRSVALMLVVLYVSELDFKVIWGHFKRFCAVFSTRGLKVRPKYELEILSTFFQSSRCRGPRNCLCNQPPLGEGGGGKTSMYGQLQIFFCFIPRLRFRRLMAITAW